MKAILFVYLTALYQGFPEKGVTLDSATVAAAETKATEVVHLFNAGVYAFPMIGAILADRLLGKFNVILWVSFIYCAGHAVLALVGRTEMGVYLGLALIAIGSGGIKPCVSANVGDQFTKENESLVGRIYQIFYFSINFGSFFSTLLTPYLYKTYGAEVAFGVPGILMGVATLVFWLGNNKFVKVPPKPGGKLGAIDFFASAALFTPFVVFAFFAHGHFKPDTNSETSQLVQYLGYLGKTYWLHYAISGAALVIWFTLFSLRQSIEQDRGFIAVLLYSLKNQDRRKEGMGFFDVAREELGDEAAEGAPAVLRVMLVFSMVSVFWALFDQHSSTWIKQAATMDRVIGWGGRIIEMEASQIPALNPLMVMAIIPFLHFGVFQPLEKRGIVVSTLKRMTMGMFLAALSFVAVAAIQIAIQDAASSGEKVHVLWQMIPYLIITVAEVLVSATGLEFAYTQAPRSMKSTIMGFWLLCVTIGNLLVAFLAPLQSLSLERFFWTFAGLMGGAAVIFAILAALYRGKTFLQEG